MSVCECVAYLFTDFNLPASGGVTCHPLPLPWAWQAAARASSRCPASIASEIEGRLLDRHYDQELVPTRSYLAYYCHFPENEHINSVHRCDGPKPPDATSSRSSSLLTTASAARPLPVDSLRELLCRDLNRMAVSVVEVEARVVL